jgi:hypothetical protein
MSAAAERQRALQRAYRERQRRGLRVIRVLVRDVDHTEALVAGGWLDSDSCDDEKAVAHAIQRVLDALDAIAKAER